MSALKPDEVLIVTKPLAKTLITQAQPSTIGVRGEKGDTGPMGPVGPAGADGARGADGRDGIDGLNGRDGVDGLNGPRGADGIDGLDGKDGATGNDGATGANGRDGANGLVGPQGDRGLPGADGPQGVAGINGRDGRDGIQGPTGSKGDTGDTGPVGPKGDKGDTGLKGDTGDTGPVGANGLPGVKGDTGPAGLNGTNGVDGATGAKGDIGPKGDTGATGAKGDTGATGAASNGLPTGGTNGQILTKTASTDFTSAWQTKTFLAVAGSSREVQYKNGNALAAASKVAINTDGNLFLAGDAVVRSANIAGRTFLSASDSYNLQTEFPLALSAGFSTQRHWQAHGDNLNIATKAWDATYQGTATAVQMGVGAALSEPQISYDTAAATGSVAGMVCANPIIKNADPNIAGFFVTLRLRIPAWTAGQRWFVGLVNNDSAPIDQNPSAMTNFIGIGVDSTDTSLQFMTRATGTVTKSDLSMPPALSGGLYTFMFYLPSVAGNISAIVRNGPYNMGSSTTALPAGRYFLKAFMSTGAVATKASISLSRGYIEHIYSVY